MRIRIRNKTLRVNFWPPSDSLLAVSAILAGAVGFFRIAGIVMAMIWGFFALAMWADQKRGPIGIVLLLFAFGWIGCCLTLGTIFQYMVPIITTSAGVVILLFSILKGKLQKRGTVTDLASLKSNRRAPA